MMEEEYKGYKIKYDETLKEFIATIGDSEYRNSDLVSVRKYIDRLDKKDFKKVDVIVDEWNGFIDAVVTSCPEDQGEYKQCWVSFKDKSKYHSRSKVPIEKAFLDNTHNREILSQMKEKEEVIEEIKTEISKLKEGMELYKP